MILIGDTHFGTKGFSADMLTNQLEVFNKQIFPYMKDNKIAEIFQFGDIFDNRTTVDISFINKIRKELFDKLVENNIIMHSLVGNHDIYLRESRKISLVRFFADLYPDNFILYEDREIIEIMGQKILIVPWIVKGEDLTYNEIKDVDYVFGHLELRNFEMTKGHCDTSAKLTRDFFEKSLNIKGVYSGHDDLKRSGGVIQYLGTPFQLNWSDYNETKGFYNFDGFELDFIENTSSKKYIKVKYNDEKNTDRNIEVNGLYGHSKLLNDEEYKELLPSLNKHEIKFIVNKAANRRFDEVLYTMKEAGINSTVINNAELSEIIGTDYIEDSEEELDTTDTRTLITDAVKTNKKELLPLLTEIFADIDRTVNKEV